MLTDWGVLCRICPSRWVEYKCTYLFPEDVGPCVLQRRASVQRFWWYTMSSLSNDLPVWHSGYCPVTSLRCRSGGPTLLHWVIADWPCRWRHLIEATDLFGVCSPPFWALKYFQEEAHRSSTCCVSVLSCEWNWLVCVGLLGWFSVVRFRHRRSVGLPVCDSYAGETSKD